MVEGMPSWVMVPCGLADFTVVLEEHKVCICGLFRTNRCLLCGDILAVARRNWGRTRKTSVGVTDLASRSEHAACRVWSRITNNLIRMLLVYIPAYLWMYHSPLHSSSATCYCALIRMRCDGHVERIRLMNWFNIPAEKREINVVICETHRLLNNVVFWDVITCGCC
jgi:hypothetical protein